MLKSSYPVTHCHTTCLWNPHYLLTQIYGSIHVPLHVVSTAYSRLIQQIKNNKISTAFINKKSYTQTKKCISIKHMFVTAHFLYISHAFILVIFVFQIIEIIIIIQPPSSKESNFFIHEQ